MLLTVVCRTKSSIAIYYSYLSPNLMKRRTLEKFGKKIKEERLKQGLSQEELAARAGVHRTYIGMIERAEKNITLENIEKLSKALRMNIADLF